MYSLWCNILKIQFQTYSVVDRYKLAIYCKSLVYELFIQRILTDFLLGVLVFTAPVAFATGSAQSTGNIFKSWCRMFAGQMFLLVMNAWCLRLFTSMVGTFLSNPLFV